MKVKNTTAINRWNHLYIIVHLIDKYGKNHDKTKDQGMKQ